MMARERSNFGSVQLTAFGACAKSPMILGLGDAPSYSLTAKITKDTKGSDIKTPKLRVLRTLRGNSCLSFWVCSLLRLRRVSYITAFRPGKALSIAAIKRFTANVHGLRCGQRQRSFLVSADRIEARGWTANLLEWTGTG